MRRVPQSVVLGLLHLYKRAVSPMLLPACRYVPTCSEYAADAVERYGAVRGAMMGVWRLLRCHPFAKGGFDPVPNLRAPAAIDSSPTNFINFRGQECPRHTSQERAWRAAPTQAGPSH